VPAHFSMMLSKLGRGCSVSARWAANKAKLPSRYGGSLGSHFHCAAALQSIEVKMPSLSPTMQEGQIVKWFKEEGETVMAGDVICDIQTDKAVVSLETDEDGTLAKILKNQDDGTIKIGTLIAVIAEEGEDWKQVGEEAKNLPTATSGGETAEAETAAPAAAAPQPTGGSTPGTEVKMPALSPTMQEGTIIKWCVQEGEKVNAGDVICEIQTDKAVVSMEVDDDCVLAKILVPEGTTNVQIGTLIAMTVEEGEDWKDVQIPSPAVTSSADFASDVTAAAAPQAAAAATEPVHAVHLAGVGPATNLLLTQYGIDPNVLEGSGPKGLTKSDVLAHIESKSLKPIDLTASVPPPPAAASVKASQGQEPAKVKRPSFDRPASVHRMELGGQGGGAVRAGTAYTDVPLTTMRSVIARRLLQSKQTSPHGYSTSECNLDAIGEIRKDFAAAGIKISVNDLVIKAAATALQYVPEVNINSVGDDDFQVMPSVDISVAVATESGLITPIVRNVPSLALNQISDTVRELAVRAKAGKLQLDEFQGGTFTISNLGMFGISEFTAIINPPQGAILAVGMGLQQINPATLKTSTFMKGTLAFDRRFIDEHLAAEFMATFRKVIENPQYMNIGPVPIVRHSSAMAGFL